MNGSLYDSFYESTVVEATVSVQRARRVCLVCEKL
ncbi:hypothetical protein THOM_1928 [Trachipleistophora hominis]|uniref:Uncharacterized protein n=1 Tax=Trachipleistophora hominis TaxID=72359 RepID=L7JWK4_TRAHO|nr:hypothetical protein THOM_1928 [Trachipleistophora hominis]